MVNENQMSIAIEQQNTDLKELFKETLSIPDFLDLKFQTHEI